MNRGDTQEYRRAASPPGGVRNVSLRQWVVRGVCCVQQARWGIRSLLSITTGLCAALVISCGVYTFDQQKLGSSLPANLKTIDIPLFANRSLQPDVAERITASVKSEMLSSRLLTLVNRDGDASIRGTVLSYSAHPYTYDAESYRNVNVQQYVVRIAVDVSFSDNTEGTHIYRGTVTGEGIYDFERETEDTGRQRAIADVVDQIIQNSIQSW